ncbi:MAG: hypothetical protein M1536_05140 [Firmicutes bacterium]|nr:hypothetical protein [Bacillota bacterium]
MKSITAFILALSFFLLFQATIFSAEKNGYFELTITGNPASPGFIKESIIILLRNKFNLKYNENLTLPGFNPSPVLPYQQALLTANISSDKPGLPQSVKVLIKNEPYPNLEPVLLMFSDHPEVISKRGLLFNAGIIRNKPVRLQYYHQGDPASPPRAIFFTFFNPNKEKCVLKVLGDFGGPDKRVFKVGHGSNVKFMKRLASDEGVIWEIPPGEHVDFNVHILKPSEVISGLYQFLMIKGKPLWFYISVRENPDEPFSAPPITSLDTHDKGAYLVTAVKVKRMLDSYEKEIYTSIGSVPLGDVFGAKPMQGDYGVIYDIEFVLKNSTSKDRNVSLYFNPRGGPAAGTFLVGSSIVESVVTKAYKETLIRNVKVKARSERIFKLRTMPEGASYYPVRIIARWN